MTNASPQSNTLPGYYIWTIGCQMNRAESDRLGRLLEQQGYQAVASPEKADIILLNSCVVREHAENRVVNKLHILKQLKTRYPNKTLALTGCMVDSNVKEISAEFPHVDHFFKPGEIPDWLSSLGCSNSDRTNGPKKNNAVCICVPIIQGCDQFCTYCIVPYRRGREKSRPLAEVTTEVAQLVSTGVREVTLVGQNVDAYGHDLTGSIDLANLLERLQKVDGLLRIRFLTNHPKDMTARLIDTIARLGKVCEQVNLPVQSGSNDILKAMRRGYTAEQYRSLVEEIRRKVPGMALSTDVIVGFPSETKSQFEETANLLAELRFDAVHIAAYSPRPGTVAARFTDDVPPEEKKGRLAILERQQASIAAEINSVLKGQTVEILVEGKEKENWFGRTRTNKLLFLDRFDGQPGQLVKARVEFTGPWSLRGKIETGGGN